MSVNPNELDDLYMIFFNEINNLVAPFWTFLIASTLPFYRVTTPSWHIQGHITITRWHGSAIVKERQRKSMEKWEIRPPLPQKPLNRSSPKFAWVIKSGTPTPMQNFIFTALHEMQTRSSDENSVCLSVRLSVCPSVCQTRDLWQNGRKVGPDFYTIRKNI